jgi:hypothetical protein
LGWVLLLGKGGYCEEKAEDGGESFFNWALHGSHNLSLGQKPGDLWASNNSYAIQMRIFPV